MERGAVYRKNLTGDDDDIDLLFRGDLLDRLS